jgi:YfiH family protein
MIHASMIVPDWRAPPNVHACVTTRDTGNMAQSPSLPGLPAAPRWLQQVHGVAVAELDLPSDGAGLPLADAAWTTRPGVVCVVRTADCLPVLLAADNGEAVAAAHAGWRGLAAGVIEATVCALRARIGQDVQLRAWLGPAIGPGHFEVGEQVRAAFLEADAGAGEAFGAGIDGRWMCDLYALARRRLAALGITEVTGGDHCTYADEARFYSHRRDVQHRGLDATGRMASFIWRT